MTPWSEIFRKSAIEKGLLVITCLLVGTFLVSISSADDSILYTERDSSVTDFHQDLLATGNLTRTDAALILKEWTTCLNLTGPIVKNVKNRDLVTADEGIQQFTRSAQALNDLVTQLGLKDTDIGTFLDDNNAVAWSLDELVDQIGAYEDLKDELVLSQNRKDASGLMSVDLRGEEIRSGIRWNYQDYAEHSVDIINISRRFGLDTAVFERSILDFAAILAEIGVEQDRRQSTIPKTIQEIQYEWCASRPGLCLPPSAITMAVQPPHGSYGDTIYMNGTVLATSGTGIKIFVDGRFIGSVKSDESRRFSLPYRIEKGRAGTHTAYGSLDTLLTKVVNFTVTKVNTSISLEARPVMENGTWTAVGMGHLLTEEGTPIRGARVYLDVDGRTSWETGITGEDGEFTISAGKILAGNRTLNAWFESDEFPLNGSESTSVTVEIPSSLGWITSMVYLLGVGGAVIGSVFFLRKKRPNEDPSTPVINTVVTEHTVEKPPIPSIEEANKMADDVMVTIGGLIDGRKTINETYRRLVWEMEARNPDLHLRAETPRIIAKTFADRLFGEQLAILVGIHEKVQYAENDATDEDLRAAREAFIAFLMEGGDH